MKLRYTERAIEDVELAFAWYEKQRRGNNVEFSVLNVELIETKN